MDFSQEFLNALAQNNLPKISDDKISLFSRFTDHLLEVNRITNLTAIRDIPSVIRKHHVDSLLVSPYIPQGARVLDIGCGPGFPSLPLAIARPDLEIVSLDSTSKKIAFVQETALLLNLKNIRAISGRAEDRSVSRQLGTFDVVVSRAVAGLNVLTELCLPYLKIGGTMIAMKGAKIEDEIGELLKGHSLELLGGEKPIMQTWELTLQDNAVETRGAVLIKKKSQSDKQYPRPYAQILKKPL